jgi:hypothetical protein
MEKDFVGLPLSIALEEIKTLGWDFEIKRTYPTRDFRGNGIWRVIRQKKKNKTIELLIAEECENTWTNGA